MSGSVTVAVVLPVRYDAPAYRQALASIAAADPAPDEVIVVTDGPSPDAARAARAGGFRVVERPGAAGPAAARNAGALLARSDALLFVDADVSVHADLIARVRDALRDPAIHACVGCYDAHPPEQNFFSQYKHLLQRFVHLQARPEGSTFWGACGAIRRHVFLDAGGFDERFHLPSVEDIDLGYRLKAAGYRIVFRPDLQVTHLKRWTMTSLVRSDVFRRALPWTWLLMRRSSAEPDLNLDYRSRAAGALSTLLVLSLAASVVNLRALAVAAVAVGLLTLVDWRLWRFFRASRGPWFAVRGLVWHWIYYFYSALTLAAGVALYPIVGRRRVGPDGVRLLAAGANRRQQM